MLKGKRLPFVADQQCGLCLKVVPLPCWLQAAALIVSSWLKHAWRQGIKKAQLLERLAVRDEQLRHVACTPDCQ